jgi:N-acetyl sugar amidotransferase
METFFGLPAEVRFCKLCVISNQRPSSTVEIKHKSDEKKETISFDKDGICDACNFQQSKEIDINWSDREQKLEELCDQYRRNTGYDVTVPGSGGKDSAFTAHILKYKYGMHPLTVTWSPHLYTEIGWRNFQNWIHVGGLDNILFTPNGKLHRHLTKQAFLNLLHPFQPFIIGQRIVGPLVAKQFGVELIMYGENQAEYGNNAAENESPKMNSKFFSVEDPLEITLGGVSISKLLESAEFNLNDFAPYIPPTKREIEESNIEVHYLGYYLKWDPQECFYYAAENTGFESNVRRTEGSYSKYSSIDDKIDPFHYFTTLIKFGLGRASYDAAQEIRNGKITREEGVNLVRLYDEEFPSLYFDEFLTYTSIDRSTFFQTLDKFRSPHLWRKVDDSWRLQRPIWESDMTN